MSRWHDLLSHVRHAREEERISTMDIFDGLGPGQGTWRTDCCRTERADAFVSVMHVPVEGLEAYFPATRFNFKYCNDNPDCVAIARAAASQGERA